MADVIPFPGQASSVRRCRCGWACPQDLAFTLSVPRSTVGDEDAAAFEVELVFTCPACGQDFTVTWSDVRVVGR